MNRRLPRTYLRKVRSYLPCSRRERKQIMAQITYSVKAFIAQEPEAGYEQLCARFGAPEVIAASCVENMGTAELLRSLRIRRRIVAIVAAVMAAVLVSWAGAVTWAIIQESRNLSGTYEVEISSGKQLPADYPYWYDSANAFPDETVEP